MTRKAFTLVELIVVITILSILWTIAFMSMLNYSKISRDSVRLSDIKSLDNVLKLFISDSWYYPEPSWSAIVSFKWKEVWIQWTVWDTMIRILDRLNSKPVDPLTGSDYTYSRLNNKMEFELWSIIEWNEYIYIKLLDSVKASWQNYKSYIHGTYNWILSKINTGSTTYILSVPTIISTEPWNILEIIRDKKLAYNWTYNIPSSYKWKLWYLWGWWFNYSSNNSWAIVVYEWTIESLKDNANLKEFTDNLQIAYLWSDVSNKWIYGLILSLITTDTDDIRNVIWNIINNNLGWEIYLENM